MRVALVALALSWLAATACAPTPATPPAGRPADAGATGSAPDGGPRAADVGPPPASSAPTSPVVQPLSPPVKVKIGGSGIAAEGAFYIAMERGYFAEEGLDVEFILFRRGADMIPPLATGELHIGGLGPDSSLFNAAGREIELKIINHNSLVTPNDRGSVLSVRRDLIDSGQYREYKDLKGMSLALSTPGSSGQLFVERVLAWGGLTADDVTWPVVQVPDMNAAFANRAIDAAWHYEPFSSATNDQGLARPIASVADIYPGAITTLVALGPVLANEQPEAVRRFAVAHLRAQRDYWHAFVKEEGGKDEIIQIFTKHTAIKDPALYTRMSMHGVEPNGLVDQRVLDDMQDFFVRVGNQREKIDLGRVIDRSYVDYALERLGRVPTP